VYEEKKQMEGKRRKKNKRSRGRRRIKKKRRKVKHKEGETRREKLGIKHSKEEPERVSF
jgi:hypothetical protein